jgi:hypothetical protein
MASNLYKIKNLSHVFPEVETYSWKRLSEQQGLASGNHNRLRDPMTSSEYGFETVNLGNGTDPNSLM